MVDTEPIQGTLGGEVGIHSECDTSTSQSLTTMIFHSYGVISGYEVVFCV